MILKLKQFLKQTDIGEEEWTLHCSWMKDIKCKNRKIIQPFWKDYSKLYDCYIQYIILSCHMIILCDYKTHLIVDEFGNDDRTQATYLLKQVGNINGNNLMPIELGALRQMARWADIIDVSDEYTYRSIMIGNCDFMVKSWYVISNTLFVRREETDIKDSI